MDIHIVADSLQFQRELEEVRQYIAEKNILPKTATYSILVKEENDIVELKIAVCFRKYNTDVQFGKKGDDW